MSKYSPYFVAGMLSGAGLALFIVFLLSTSFTDVGLSGFLRPATGAIGLAFLISGGVWNSRIRMTPNVQSSDN